MSKKRPAPSKAKPSKPSSSGSGKSSKSLWIFGAIALVIAVGVFAASRGSGGGTGAASSTAVPADEAKYLGRLLPAAYVEPTLGKGGAVTADTSMAQIDATASDSGVSVAVADIASKRNVGFEYKKADGTSIPLIAYVKPSGKIFVGVSYCVPCQGTGQTLTTDGKLTCDSCGTKRDPETGVGISGACKLYPLDELPSKIEGKKLVVDKAALDGWTVQPTDRKVGE